MSADILAIAGVGVVEAIVFLLRFRSAHSPSWAWSALTTMLISTTRVVFVLTGARVVLSGDGDSVWIVGAVYVASTTLTTAPLHAWLERRKRKASEIMP